MYVCLSLYVGGEQTSTFFTKFSKMLDITFPFQSRNYDFELDSSDKTNKIHQENLNIEISKF